MTLYPRWEVSGDEARAITAIHEWIAKNGIEPTARDLAGVLGILDSDFRRFGNVLRRLAEAGHLEVVAGRPQRFRNRFEPEAYCGRVYIVAEPLDHTPRPQFGSGELRIHGQAG